MHCKTRDQKNIFFEVTGNLASKKTLLFLNGLSQSTISWGLVTPHFKDEYKIILMDFIFQGQSDKEGEIRDFDTHAQDVLSVLDCLGVNSVILVGLSYGSLVGQHFSLLFPDRISKLTLLSTFAHKTPYYEAIENSWSRALETGGYSLMLDVMLPFVLSDSYFENPLIPIEVLKQTRKDVVEAKALQKLMAATSARKDYRGELQKITCPALVIHGALDTLFPIYMGKAVAEAIPGCTFIAVQNAGHTLNIEAVPIVCSHIHTFANS